MTFRNNARIPETNDDTIDSLFLLSTCWARIGLAPYWAYIYIYILYVHSTHIIYIHTYSHGLRNVYNFCFSIGDNVIGIFAYTSRRYVVRKFFDILKARGSLRIIVITCPIQNPVVLEIKMLNANFPSF